jgi:hypothetical protein
MRYDEYRWMLPNELKKAKRKQRERKLEATDTHHMLPTERYGWYLLKTRSLIEMCYASHGATTEPMGDATEPMVQSRASTAHDCVISVVCQNPWCRAERVPYMTACPSASVPNACHAWCSCSFRTCSIHRAALMVGITEGGGGGGGYKRAVEGQHCPPLEGSVWGRGGVRTLWKANTAPIRWIPRPDQSPHGTCSICAL